VRVGITAAVAVALEAAAGSLACLESVSRGPRAEQASTGPHGRTAASPLGRRCGSCRVRSAAKSWDSQPRAARVWQPTKTVHGARCRASHTAHAAVGPLEPPQLRVPQRAAHPCRWWQAPERRSLAHVGRHDRVALNACADLHRHRLLPSVLHPERLLEHLLQLLVDWVSFCRWRRPRQRRGGGLRPAASLTGTSHVSGRSARGRIALCSGAARCSA